MKVCIHPLYPWNPTFHQKLVITLRLSSFWLAIGDAISFYFEGSSLINGHVLQLKVSVFLEFSFRSNAKRQNWGQEASLQISPSKTAATDQGLPVLMIF